MFDIGLQELVLIFVIALLVFGPKNLPQLGRSLGRAMREFKRASDEFRTTIETNLEINEPYPIPPPVTSPLPVETTPTAADAGVSTDTPRTQDEGLKPDAEAAADIGEPYIAQRGSKLFHSRTCAWVKRITEPERVYFKQVIEARDAGFSACPVCEPWEPG